MRPVLYLAITSHGFGHAVRTAAVAAKVQEFLPETLLVFVTTVPNWLLAGYIKGDYIQRAKKLDVGVVQADSFTMDQPTTLAKLQDIRHRADRIIADEVDFLRLNKVGLVLADIPPLAAPIAHAAGVPCWFMSNFGWDFIYRDWGGDFVPEADWITTHYHSGDRLLRLPLNEPMTRFANITDAGLIGGSPNQDPQVLRETFSLTKSKAKTILLTFGGLGLDGIPYDVLAQFPDYQFITFDRQAPDLDNLRKITDVAYRPVDFFPLCDRLVSKPGFGTFAEAMLQDLPVATLPRNDFAEGAVLLEGLQKFSHHQILDPTTFRQGDWDFIRETPTPPTGDRPIDKSGLTAIATEIANFLS
ncbi:glycosyl transferase [[Limnothrix rosea] IAM M-220]|uniref:glycosyl transferase n=1 Tax=[Limnothrix rosea] IAM M-220 TaxID=454133 RepID=UPI00095CBF7E|nr:glycosyl transferase [[Limnothrix rosea] IAM M-220]OKH16941.1 glycosyl transferase [[Limnothrix rosea] IAM M-220]